MPLMPINEPQPASYSNDQKAIWREIKALWKTKSVAGAANVSAAEAATQTTSGVQFAYDYAIVP